MYSFEFINLDKQLYNYKFATEKIKNLYILKVSIVSLKIKYYYPLFMEDELDYDITAMITKPSDYKTGKIYYECVTSYKNIKGIDVMDIFNKFMEEKEKYIELQPRYIRHCDFCDLDITGDNFARHLKSKKHLLNCGQKVEEIEARKFYCECGSIVSSSGIAKHKKTLKHVNFMLN